LIAGYGVGLSSAPLSMIVILTTNILPGPYNASVRIYFIWTSPEKPSVVLFSARVDRPHLPQPTEAAYVTLAPPAASHGTGCVPVAGSRYAGPAAPVGRRCPILYACGVTTYSKNLGEGGYLKQSQLRGSRLPRAVSFPRTSAPWRVDDICRECCSKEKTVGHEVTPNSVK